MSFTLQFEPLGDSALLCRLSATPDVSGTAQRLADAIADSGIRGVSDAAAAYDTLAVYFDATRTTGDAVGREVARISAALPAVAPKLGPLVTIPVSYDGADLEFVAHSAGLTPEQVIELHSAAEYTAQAVGFVPGFAYLGDLHEQLRLPRRSSPRPRVAPGSVAIAGRQTAVYPFATPGGWHLIGSTTAQMFDVQREQPALVTVGTRVRFAPA